MSSSADVINEFIEGLEEDADEIVVKIEKLYDRAEKGYDFPGRGPSLGAAQRGDANRFWEDPEGGLKDLQDQLREDYELWYAKARELVSSHRSDRLEEFERRRTDVKEYINLNKNAKHEPEKYVNSASEFFGEQRSIVKSIPGKIEAESLSLRRQISDTFSKDELQQARELLDEELTRAAGVVSGVALERHLQLESDEADLDYSHSDGISSLAQTLYEGDEINSTTLSNLETLGKIRNDCAHANPQQPEEHRVKKLIEDTEDYVRGRGI